MNVLFIGDPSSIHDYKWTSFIARRLTAKTYFIFEGQNLPDPTAIEKYRDAGITMLAPVPMFSVSSPWRTWKAMARINQLIVENNIGLVHVIFPTPHLFWLTLSKVMTVVSTRGSDVLVVTRELVENTGLKNKILYHLLKYNLKKIEAITSTSEPQKEYLEKHFPFLKNKTSIVRTGVDVNYIERVSAPNKSLDEFIIFSPRFFTKIYNITSQVNAIKQLPEKLQKRIKLVLVKGKRNDISYEKSVYKSLENAEFDHEIISYLNQEEMIIKYKTSHLILMTPYSDGTPNSALEAMVCKAPLIISDLPYNSPLFTKTCLKADPNDENDISKKIRMAMENYPAEMIEKAYQAVKIYGSQAIEMQKIINLYESLANKKQ